MKKRFEELTFITHKAISALSRNYLQDCVLGLQLDRCESLNFQTSDLHPLQNRSRKSTIFEHSDE